MQIRNLGIIVAMSLSLVAQATGDTMQPSSSTTEVLPRPTNRPMIEESGRDYFDDTAIGNLDLGQRVKPSVSGQQQSLPANESARMLDQQTVINYGSSFPQWHVRSGKVFTPICHEPLIFEDIGLERFGNERKCQSVVSAAKFFLTLPALPYHVVARSTTRCHCHYYPRETGRCLPDFVQTQRISKGGAVYEAFVVVSLIALIP